MDNKNSEQATGKMNHFDIRRTALVLIVLSGKYITALRTFAGHKIVLSVQQWEMDSDLSSLNSACVYNFFVCVVSSCLITIECKVLLKLPVGDKDGSRMQTG